MGLIQQLKDRYKGHQEKRFLEKYGCKTWREYELRYEPDIGPKARWSHTFYHGYNHIYPLDPDYGMPGVLPYHDLCEKMMEWCEQNCTGKWRNDWHHGFWDGHGNYELNDIGVNDMMFFAFKEESDYVWFKLAWQ